MGDKWSNLHPDIQKRFEKNPEPGAPLRYRGILDELSCSFAGKLLGFLTRPLIRGALIPHSATNVPVDIQVYAEPGDPAIYKHRIYHLPGRELVEFTSFMRRSTRGEVLEYVGFGLGMKLLVFEKEGNLHFQSDGYFWDLGFVRIPVPGLLSPGKTYLMHINEGAGRFRIRIDIDHVLLGPMFVQAGVFEEIQE
ncbi:DUF4166 domain-containing protein [Nisaea acidiphila]|uniref:DUF4166 domain-containing protein n=1 Tax=Nisaea acidiphila TaxID=1862145 RepID=A0A9J7AXS1_9PROT|nr:DUF4166 domain-containing protein [Nisaea acidiphila]UUX51870.1 DUF4166 domain-containing protein [Nisaea acidiphila]